MKTYTIKILALAGLLNISACGTASYPLQTAKSTNTALDADSSPSQGDSTSADQTAILDPVLPSCGDENIRQMIYVEETGKTLYCTLDHKWAEIPSSTPPGESSSTDSQTATAPTLLTKSMTKTQVENILGFPDSVTVASGYVFWYYQSEDKCTDTENCYLTFDETGSLLEVTGVQPRLIDLTSF